MCVLAYNLLAGYVVCNCHLREREKRFQTSLTSVASLGWVIFRKGKWLHFYANKIFTGKLYTLNLLKPYQHGACSPPPFGSSELESMELAWTWARPSLSVKKKGRKFGERLDSCCTCAHLWHAAIDNPIFFQIYTTWDMGWVYGNKRDLSSLKWSFIQEEKKGRAGGSSLFLRRLTMRPIAWITSTQKHGRAEDINPSLM